MAHAAVNLSGPVVLQVISLLPNLRQFAFLLLFLLLSTVSLAAPQGPAIGKVTLLLGTVTGVDQDGDTFEVVRGMDLHAGYSLDTGARSFVRAVMNDGTRLTLSQNSSATLDEFNFNEASRTGGFNATVRKGGFKYASGRLGEFSLGRQHSRISTPAGVIGVRGTEIEAVLDGGKLTISIPKGEIDITFTRSDGTQFTQRVGVDQPIQIVQVEDGGELQGLQQLPEALQIVVQVLEQQVRQAEEQAAATDSSTTDSNQDDENTDDDANSNNEDSQPQTTVLDLNTNTLTTPTDDASSPAGGGGTVIDIPASPSTVP